MLQLRRQRLGYLGTAASQWSRLDWGIRTKREKPSRIVVLRLYGIYAYEERKQK